MKGTIKSILILTILCLSLLPACGRQPSADTATPPDTDQPIIFREDGTAVLQGHPGAGWNLPDQGESIDFKIPVKVEGIKTDIVIRMYINPETEISSSRVEKMDARTFHSTHPSSLVGQAFLYSKWAEVTFVKKGSKYVATSIHEIDRGFTLFEKRPVIENVFSSDNNLQYLVVGKIEDATETDQGITLIAQVPIKIHNVTVNVLLPIRYTVNTEVFTLKNGFVPYKTPFSGRHVTIVFTRFGNILTARKITEIP